MRYQNRNKPKKRTWRKKGQCREREKTAPFIFSKQDREKRERERKENQPEPENSWKLKKGGINIFNRKTVKENWDLPENITKWQRMEFMWYLTG